MPKLKRVMLTKDAVGRAKSEGAAYRLHDAKVPGLSLRVLPSAAKSWAIHWGRGQAKTIGKFPVMTLEGARAEARRKLAEIEDHGAPLSVIEAAAKPANAKPPTLREFVLGEYRDWMRHELKRGQEAVDRILSVFAALADTVLPEIDRKTVEGVITARRRKGVSKATTNRDLAAIKAALAKAVDWGRLDVHPLAKLKPSKIATGNVVRYLTPAEGKRLRDALAKREAERRESRERHNAWHAQRGSAGHPQWPAWGFTDHLMPMVLVAMNTGLRRGELFGLRWADVNLQSKLLTVTASNAKSQKTRHVPLNAEALDVLKRWKRQGKDSGLVFPSPAGARFDNIQTSWEALVKSANLTDFRFHDLRHDFASKLVMASVDLNTVRELLGHGDIKMTLRYAHLAPHKMADAVARLV